MAFFPDVAKGDVFQPNMLLENNLRHMVNSMDGFTAKPVFSSGNPVRLQVYNCSGTTLAAGTAVNFEEDGKLCGTALPVVKLEDPAKLWGVITARLKKNEVGGCILTGPVEVSFSGTGDYAEPSKSSPDVFTRGSTGAPVIFADGSKGWVLLGASSQDSYDGPFALSYDSESKKVKVNTGYASMNGEWISVSETALSPSDGKICVCTKLGETGTWSTPEIKFSTPGQLAFPVGECKKNGDSVTVCSYRVPVAVFIVAGTCSSTN